MFFFLLLIKLNVCTIIITVKAVKLKLQNLNFFYNRFKFWKIFLFNFNKFYFHFVIQLFI